MYWFLVTVPDPTNILPLASATTFFGSIEFGKDHLLTQSLGARGEFMLNFFCFCAVMSLPVAVNFDAVLLVQTRLLKAPAYQMCFGI